MGAHDKKDACATCGGKGKVPVEADGQDSGSGTQTMNCPTCKGTGKA
jgi:DnaJ-class molecular chaperone